MLAYVSAKKRILQFIREKNLQPGDRLPTEVELSDKLDISRLTLREALNALKSDGVIHSIQGKGTFIACDFNNIADSLNVNYGVTEMIEMSGYQPGTASYEKKVVKADGCVASKLNVEEGTEVLLCSRIRLADETPVAFTCDYIAPRIEKELLSDDSDVESLYSFIEDKCEIQLGVCLTELIPTVADEKLSEILKVSLGSPLLKLRASVNDAFGSPLIYADEYLRPDKFKFIVSRGR